VLEDKGDLELSIREVCVHTVYYYSFIAAYDIVLVCICMHMYVCLVFAVLDSKMLAVPRLRYCAINTIALADSL
jgi:hypothetical protein